MLRVLQRVVGAQINRGAVDLLRRDSVEWGRNITTPIVVEYWIESTKKILKDLNCTSKEKLKGTVSLLRDEAYR
ncbi:ATP-dependent zinc metalloprotease FtsH [Gossypium australe]|uniref:ATP-dependent zinc metalloprotease FtsH n=1 Tax=Gossypium australe TaxID=47621 RepID=A0A5B6VKL6_9ROSI|nr:ATP-dependent zinc metalloprotease FtsH [Gossypium australe]